MKCIIILFCFLFCSTSFARMSVHSEKQSTEIGRFSIQAAVMGHIRYRNTGNRSSSGEKELSVMHIVPMKFYKASCPEEYQKNYHLHNEWQTQYQTHSCQNSRCRNEIINGRGASPNQCWNMLNKYGHSMEWLQRTVRGVNKEGRDLYEKCPSECSFYTTVIRYYTGNCEKERSEVLVYCGHKKSASRWNIDSYIIDSSEQQLSSLVDAVFNNFVNHFYEL